MSSWYSFIKIAGPTQKIQKYNISDPYLKSFVFKYENSVPWDQINTSDDIQKYIRQILLKQLYSKIDPNSEDNNYIKDIDLDSVNKDKKENFFKWWNYITEENDVYKEFLKEEYNRRYEYSRDKIWQEIPEEIKLQMPDMNPQNIQQQNI